MARKTIEALLAQAASTLADNVAEEISPADVRAMITDFVDTMTPAVGAMVQTSTTLSLTTTAVPLPMGSVIANASPEWTANLASGSLSRAVPVSAGAMSNQFLINGSVAGVNNADVTVMLYKNGAATAFQTVVTTRGAGIQCTFNFSAIDAVVKADATYQLMTKSSVTGSQVFTNLVFAANNIPVRSLT